MDFDSFIGIVSITTTWHHCDGTKLKDDIFSYLARIKNPTASISRRFLETSLSMEAMHYLQILSLLTATFKNCTQSTTLNFKLQNLINKPTPVFLNSINTISF